jgi:hypothetical protein
VVAVLVSLVLVCLPPQVSDMDMPMTWDGHAPDMRQPEAKSISTPIKPVGPTRLIKGVSTWYDYHEGQAAAGPRLREGLGPHWRGQTVKVCSDTDCVSVVLTDWCACQPDKRVIDLDVHDFAFLADPVNHEDASRGVIPVTVTR